ncbi:mediator of RNA polymerase II transcription subunit 32-like [Curcuma longa]|uniref:mediator of RNA polymerase II transcription subunit 32-like n=1 Tax=Curcuma longa TaxID=136217 RepID=UPI003D9F7A69
MEKAAEEAQRAYDGFVVAMAAVVEANAAACGERTAATEAALEALRDQYRSFLCALDAPEATVDASKQRFTAEIGGFVDESAVGRMPPVFERAPPTIDLFTKDGRVLYNQRSPSSVAGDVAVFPLVNDHDGKSSDCRLHDTKGILMLREFLHSRRV